MKKGYIPQDQRKKILMLSDDIRLTSGVGCQAKEIVTNTAHHFNWINLGGAVKHPEAGKAFDLSSEVNKMMGLEDSNVKVIHSDGYGNAPMLRNFNKLQESLTGNLIGASFKTYANTKVRQGQKVTNPKKHALDYATHVQKHFDKMIGKVKTPSAKDKYKKQQREYVKEFRKHASNLGNIVLFQNLMIDAKMQIVRKLRIYSGWEIKGKAAQAVRC